MKNFKNKTVVITGAGSGIGKALAMAFAAKNARLALCDWDEAGLQTTLDDLAQAHDVASDVSSDVSTDIYSQVFDVASLDEFTSFRAAVIEKFGQVDVVINNAGVALSQTINEVSIEDFEWIMGVNFWGMVYGTKLFLPDLLAQPEGCVVNVSSVFGLISVPTQGTYNASKFAIRGVTEALWHELEDTNVTALSVHPGGIKTNIARNARFFIDYTGSVDHDITNKNFDKNAHTSPDKAASIIIRAIKKKQRQVLVGPDAHVIDRIQRLMPTTYWNVLKRLVR